MIRMIREIGKLISGHKIMINYIVNFITLCPSAWHFTSNDI